MIKIENVDVFGFEAAIRGMRNPMNSWDKCDSLTVFNSANWEMEVHLGENDLKLMKTLSKAGNDHGKFLRMINVTFDVTSHHTWWSEFDTYKVSVVRNSCSKMHKIHVKEFVRDDFSHEGVDAVGGMAEVHFQNTIDTLEWLRQEFNETQDKKYWRAIIELLPMGYNIRATIQLNYQVLKTMYHARKNHKLDEWVEFCEWCETLPYFKEICMEV